MKRRSNFTLIEVVVAIAILVVVAGLIGVIGASFYNGYDRSLRVTAKLKTMMAIDNLMDTHIRNMVPFEWKDGEGTSRLLFDGEENRIFFTTLRRNYGSRPGALLFIRVFVEDEKLVAEYSPYPRFPWVDEEDESMPWTREIIAENVRQVTFSYAEESAEDENAVEFLDEYREGEYTALPLAVLMKIEFTDGSSEQWLRRAAGISKESTFGYRESQTEQDEEDSETGSESASTRRTTSSSAVRPGGSRTPGGRPGGNRTTGGRTPGGAR